MCRLSVTRQYCRNWNIAQYSTFSWYFWRQNTTGYLQARTWHYISEMVRDRSQVTTTYHDLLLTNRNFIGYQLLKWHWLNGQNTYAITTRFPDVSCTGLVVHIWDSQYDMMTVFLVSGLADADARTWLNNGKFEKLIFDYILNSWLDVYSRHRPKLGYRVRTASSARYKSNNYWAIFWLFL